MRGKLLLTAALTAAMTFGLCACGGKESTSTDTGDETTTASQPASGEFATLGDVLAGDYPDFYSVYDETTYTCAFELDGTYYRIDADLPAGMYDSLNEADFDDAKIAELLSDVAVKEQVVLAESAPTQEELDTLVGKTGAELAAEGYVVDSVMVNDDMTDCTAYKAPFSYMITFEGAVADENTTDYAGAVQDLTVSSISFGGLGYQALE